MKTLRLYDFDGTITKRDSFNDFIIYTFGINKFFLNIIKNSFTIFQYVINKKTNAEVKTKMFQMLYRNEKYNKYLEDCKKYSNNRLNSIIRPEFKKILNNIDDNIIITASFKEWIEPWAKKNNIKIIISSQFETNYDIIEGTIKEENSCYGKNKITMLKKEVPNIEKNYNYIIAYGDSKSDKYYMKIADEKIMIKKNKFQYIEENAIITDGLWRKSVSAIRSIGKRGINVFVTGDTILTVGMWSKFCKKKKKIANSSANPEKFGSDLLKILNSYFKPVLFPMEESTIKWCCDNYELIKDKCYTLLPKKENMGIALCKALTMKQAQKININCPKTYFPTNYKDLEKIIQKEKLDDYVIKPYRGSGSSGLLYGSTSKEISLKEHWEKFGKLILQERIPSSGEGVGVSIIMDKNSNVKGVFCHKRLEQYPNSGAPSTQRIGIINKKLIDNSIKLLKSINWIGVAMVEWKYNINTKEYALMEINPRFWGSLELAVRSGVDFPFLYYQLAKNRNVKAITNYSINTKCRWLIPGDILRYITKKDKEKLFTFLKGSLKESEEWDKQDKRCFFASIICQGLLVLNPKFWKYIRR